ncbi:hypothetical protein AVE30378_02531 [Achromobacter veterisilvae]|uniref:HTH cro/C1-type domain-containing protein n=1 Tax=Achromobacter veterisilvae TaxID=2069367 RepID=A0A446CHB7_9BURK|nr:hypothetical protein [Achromobacter veterisilvae]SSW67260.1 hypothetical protein AVE30378_02531 [Achromobacter veterisilvae]
MSMITTVRSQLLARKGSWPAICDRAGVSYSWLTKYAQGKITNPGSRQLEAVARCLESSNEQAAAVAPVEHREGGHA